MLGRHHVAPPGTRRVLMAHGWDISTGGETNSRGEFFLGRKYLRIVEVAGFVCFFSIEFI